MRKKIHKSIGTFLAFLMGVMLLSVLWQVFTRYIMGEASTFTSELARFLMIWIGLLGGAYISGENLHVAIDLLPSRYTGRKGQILQIVINLIVIVFAIAALIIGGGQLVFISYRLGQTSAAMQIPLSLVYVILPLSGILVCYYKITDIITLRHAMATSSPSLTTKNKEQTDGTY